MTRYVHMLQGCCTVGMCMSLCMAGDYACAYTFLFTVDCSGHITCTVTNGGDGRNTASKGCYS